MADEINERDRVTSEKLKRVSVYRESFLFGPHVLHMEATDSKTDCLPRAAMSSVPAQAIIQ